MASDTLFERLGYCSSSMDGPDARSIALALIRAREDLAKVRADGMVEAYPDPKRGWAVPTIGWGSTGPHIQRDTVWTRAQCDQDLETRLDPILAWASGLHAELPAGAVAALCSLAWNVGQDHLENCDGHGDEAHVVRYVREGNWEAAAQAFLAWDHVDGVVVDGLKIRRGIESRIFLDAFSGAQAVCEAGA